MAPPGSRGSWITEHSFRLIYYCLFLGRCRGRSCLSLRRESAARGAVGTGQRGCPARRPAHPVSDPCRPRRAGPTRRVKLPSTRGPSSWVAAGRLLRRLVRPSCARRSPAGPTAMCSRPLRPGGRSRARSSRTRPSGRRSGWRSRGPGLGRRMRPARVPGERGGDVGAAGRVVVEHPGRQGYGRVRQAVHRLRPRSRTCGFPRRRFFKG